MIEYYLYFKAFHLFAVIAWMVGMLYLPRLYVYHAGAKVGSEMDKTFQTMESKLLRIIMNPAMIISVLLGLYMLIAMGIASFEYWIHLKITLVLVLLGFHGFLAKCRKDFVKGVNKRSARFFRLINEIPAVILLVIVILAVVKPF